MGDIVICDATVLDVASVILGEGRIAGVIIVWLGILENDIPGVQEARDIGETAESKVDDRVSRTEAYFDPHWTHGVSS